jgi:hypothetical protein
MALLADRIDIGAAQKVWIRTTVRKMTCSASLCLHHRVLEHKRSSPFGVAICAKRVLSMGSPGWVFSNSAVRVVAVSAFNEAILNLVSRWIRELRLNIRMALEAQLDLGYL